MIHNSPPIAPETPLQSNLITLIGQSDSKSKKKTNHFTLKKRKEPINGIHKVLSRQKKRYNVLALDLGTNTGWAIKDGERIFGATQSFKPRRFDGGGYRYLAFQNFLDDVHADHDIGIVYFEEVRAHAGVDAAHAYGGFMAVLTSWCERHRIPYHGVPVKTIKKFITGSGKASKDDVIASVMKLGYMPDDDNHADALALLHWALENRFSSPGVV